MGSSILFAPPYLKNVFYDPLLDALDIDNAQIGWLVSAYAITATICYLPSGFIADRIRVRTLATTGYGITAILTFVYAALPSFGTLLAVFVGMGLSTILIWWGVRFKLVRLVSDADGYAPTSVSATGSTAPSGSSSVSSRSASSPSSPSAPTSVCAPSS